MSSGLLSPTELQICQELASGAKEFAFLQSKLGLSSQALKKHLGVISASSLGPLINGRSIMLAGNTSLLSSARILSLSSRQARAALLPNGLEVLLSADSGHNYVRQKRVRPFVVFCEQQTRGRGRYGRLWQSPFCAGLFLSMICSKETFCPMGTQGLSLAVGVMMMRAICKLGLSIKLKWPNDLLDANGKKFGGILIEALDKDIIIGIGLNHRLHNSVGTSLCDMAQKREVSMPDRNAIAALMLDALFKGIQEFSQGGFERFRKEWSAVDYLYAKKVVVRNGEPRLGLCVGVASNGALLLTDSSGRTQQIHSGTLHNSDL